MTLKLPRLNVGSTPRIGNNSGLQHVQKRSTSFTVVVGQMLKE